MTRILALTLVLFAAAAARASADAVWYGFNDNAAITHDLTPRQDAALLARAGANSVRMTVDWNWVQSGRNRPFDFRFYRPMYRAWRAQGIHPLVVVMGAPRW